MCHTRSVDELRSVSQILEELAEELQFEEMAKANAQAIIRMTDKEIEILRGMSKQEQIQFILSKLQ